MEPAAHPSAPNEERFQNLVRQFPIGIALLTGPEYRVEEANDAYCRFVGCQPDRVRGKTIFEILPEFQWPSRHLLDSVQQTGKPVSLYEQPSYFDNEGRKREAFVTLTYQPYREAEDAITGVMILVQDVTEQVAARRAADESEQRFRNLVEEAPVATSVFYGREMQIRYVNEAMLNIIGKDKTILGKTLKEAMPELKGQPFFERLDRVFTTGETYWGKEDRADLLVDGRLQTFYFNHSYKALHNRRGVIYGILNMAVDVTDKVLARQQLEESEKTLRNTILQAPVAICILRGPSFVVEIANDRMFEFWDRKAADMLQEPLFSAIPEAWSRENEALLAGVLISGKPFYADELPVTLLREGKRELVYVNVSCEPLQDADGRITGIMAIASEVTEQVMARKKIEEMVSERTRELEDANKNLQKSNAELEEFAYITSHDLQEPLRKITFFAHMLENSLGQRGEQPKTYLHKIVDASLRMRHLIRDILAFSQLSKKTAAFEPVDLAALMRHVLGDYDLLIRQKGARIDVDPLPRVEAIPVQLNQLFGNLLSNALKFTRKDVPPLITITAERFDEEAVKAFYLRPGLPYCHLSFRDNGIGFEPREARQIFDIFQRLHGHREFAGTGIGLALCKKIVLNHQGAIWAESEKGKGAVFHVVLPERQS